MKKSADPIIQEKESANSAYKKSEMFLRRIGRPVLFPTMKSLDSGAKKAAGKADDAKEEAAACDKSGFFTPNDKIDFSKVEIEPLLADVVDFETFSKSDFRAVKVKECVAVAKSKKLLQFTLDDGTGTDRTILSGIHAFYEPEELDNM